MKHAPHSPESHGLQALLAALDAAAAPVDFFLRDDDAGWADERLFALLDCTARAGVPLDLAVIPQATGEPLAAELRARFDDAGGLLGLHQHGHAHTNFETTGRKCEFGPARDLESQRRDLTSGRDRLQGLFGDRLDGFFTPPWNRCQPATPGLLAELGYTGLSRDRGCAAQQSLPELNVDVDWCKQQRLALEAGTCDETGTAHAMALQLAQQVQAQSRAGLMFHHAQMSDAELQSMRAWLACWAHHPRARWRPMRALLPAASPAAA